MKKYKEIPLLQPDLPKTEELLPWLESIESSRIYTNFGPLAIQFEDALLDWFRSNNFMTKAGTFQCSLASSATSALELALLSHGVQSGDRVLIPAFTFPATATAVIRTGAVPVFSDCDLSSWVMTPEIAAEVCKNEAIDLIMPVAAFGCPLPLPEWEALSTELGIPIVIDAAGAFGSQSVSNLVDVIFSFHATKCLGIGEGGLYVTGSPSRNKKFRQLSNFGLDDDGLIVTPGQNSKLSEYHAAVGLAQLARWEMIRSKRRSVFEKYEQAFERFGLSDKLQLQEENPQLCPTLLPVQIKTKVNELRLFLLGCGVHTRSWYTPTLEQHPGFAQYITDASSLKNSEGLREGIIGLPFYPSLSNEDVNFVVGQLLVWLQEN